MDGTPYNVHRGQEVHWSCRVFPPFHKELRMDSQAAQRSPGLQEQQVEESPYFVDSCCWRGLLHIEEEMCYGTCIGLCRPEEALPAGDRHIWIRLGHHTAASMGGWEIPPSSVCKLHSAWKRGQLPFIKVGIPSPQVGRDTAVQGIFDVSALHHANWQQSTHIHADDTELGCHQTPLGFSLGWVQLQIGVPMQHWQLSCWCTEQDGD